jgi:hypothetical protein
MRSPRFRSSNAPAQTEGITDTPSKHFVLMVASYTEGLWASSKIYIAAVAFLTFNAERDNVEL